MQKNLLESLAPRLRELNRGGYTRVYRRGGKTFPTEIHALIAEILDSLGSHYATGVRLPKTSLVADFVLDNTIILIEKRPRESDQASLLQSGKKCIVIERSKTKGDRLDSGIRAFQVGELDDGRLQTIFLDDPSFNFDYAHILPQTEKCSVMHGHTSSALIELVGVPKDGMVIDFNDAKPIIREAIREMDHKLFISERYVAGRDATHINLKFTTVHGDFELRVPKATTLLLEGEATVENLAQELIARIAPKMPDNVRAVGVYVYEGLNKGTHLLAEVHRREGEKRRRTR